MTNSHSITQQLIIRTNFYVKGSFQLNIFLTALNRDCRSLLSSNVPKMLGHGKGAIWGERFREAGCCSLTSGLEMHIPRRGSLEPLLEPKIPTVKPCEMRLDGVVNERSAS